VIVTAPVDVGAAALTEATETVSVAPVVDVAVAETARASTTVYET